MGHIWPTGHSLSITVFIDIIDCVSVVSFVINPRLYVLVTCPGELNQPKSIFVGSFLMIVAIVPVLRQTALHCVKSPKRRLI